LSGIGRSFRTANVTYSIGALGLPYKSRAKRTLDSALQRNLRNVSLCKPPAGPVSAKYGQAQLDITLNTFRDCQKYPPYAAPLQAAQ
jgi:hypothetical protein